MAPATSGWRSSRRIEEARALAQGADQRRRLERAVGELFCAGALITGLAVVATALLVPAAARSATLRGRAGAAVGLLTERRRVALRRAARGLRDLPVGPDPLNPIYSGRTDDSQFANSLG